MNNNPRAYWMRSVAKEWIVELFCVSLLSYLLLYLLEDFFIGFVTSAIPLNVLLGLTILSGIVTVISPQKSREAPNLYKKQHKKIRLTDSIIIVGIGIVAGLLVYYKIRSLGNLAYYIAPLTSLIISLLSFLLLTEEEQ